jgi:hypothetical protein
MDEDLPSRAVINQIAAIEDVDPVELEPPLQSVIDLDALDSLYRAKNGASVDVTFKYGDYVVTVDGDTDVTVRDAEI